MFVVYVIRSIPKNYRYIGLTNNLERRLFQHNKGYNRTTKFYAPFRLVLTEKYPNRKEARLREKYFKSGVGREYLNQLESNN